MRREKEEERKEKKETRGADKKETKPHTTDDNFQYSAMRHACYTRGVVQAWHTTYLILYP